MVAYLWCKIFFPEPDSVAMSHCLARKCGKNISSLVGILPKYLQNKMMRL